jgi:WD40 repeat protein/serine/threonine protein kinase/tetratricopeptide (TPR) repeat protein
MTTSSDARNPVGALAEEFLDRKRRGEHPTLREYVERYPELAGEIRNLFPALLMMEDLGESPGGTTGSLAADHGAALGIRLERLGDYRILREIGRGGMGVVYEAEQESLGRRVALKVLSAGLLVDPKQVRRFEHEAKAAARLHHTNIVPVFGVGRQDGHHYFVMQFIAGLGLDMVLDDLRRLRRAKSEASPAVKPVRAASRVAGLTGADVARSLFIGRFHADKPPGDGSLTEPLDDAALAPANGPPADSGASSAIPPGSSELSTSSDPGRQFYRSVARIGIQVAEALEYANRQGILHRDVKPSNLLLDNHGNVWVADFGLAKMAESDDLTRTGDILGTIRYMAPERFSNQCDARSDLYSLGLTLYELVALRPAYEAPDRHTLIDRVLHEEPVRLKKLAHTVPRDLETIVAKAIARDPATRYATAGALAEDLQRFVEDRPITARRVSAGERLASWCRRNKLLSAAVGLVAVLMITLTINSLWAAYHFNLLVTAEQSAHRQADRRLAILAYERGQSACERGDTGTGLLLFLECWRSAIGGQDPAMQRLARRSVAAWHPLLPRLRAVFPWGLLAVVSPDGKAILTGSGDKTAQLWDITTGKPIGPPLQHRGMVRSAAFSPDGKTILTACDDKTAWIWRTGTGEPVGKPRHLHGSVQAGGFSPDGKKALVIETVTPVHPPGTTLLEDETSTVRLWDVFTGTAVGKPLRSSWDNVLKLSPDGKTILIGGRFGRTRLWDTATGLPIGPPLSRFLGSSPDGTTILTTSGYQKETARLWDATTGRPGGQPIQHQGSVRAAAVSPDGKTVLTASDYQTARLWDAGTGQPVGSPLRHRGAVDSVAFSPDGKTVLTTSDYQTARLWDAATGQPIGDALPRRHLAGASFSPDGKSILVTTYYDGMARLWDAAILRPIARPFQHQGACAGVVFGSEGKTVLLIGGSPQRMGGSGSMQLRDITTGKPIGRPFDDLIDDLSKPPERRRTISMMAASPGGKTVLTAAADGTARLWDTVTGKPIGKQLAHQNTINAAAFSPDGKTVLTGSDDKTARLWNVTTVQPIGTPLMHLGAVWSVAFSPDGKTALTGGLDSTARLWNAATGQPIGTPLVCSEWVGVVSFSPDGKIIFTRGTDGTIREWDAVTGNPIRQTLAHPQSSRAMAFRSDGQITHKGNDNTTAQSPASRQRDITPAAISPDGQTVVTQSEDQRVWIRDAATKNPIGPPLSDQGAGKAHRVSAHFSPDGKWFLIDDLAWAEDPDRAGLLRLWKVPDLPDDFARIVAWVEVLTGLELDDEGNSRYVDYAAWQERLERLRKLGGPPVADEDQLLDPILYGPDPLARARAWMERKRWAEAEAALDEVVKAWPEIGSFWAERGRFFLTHSRPAEAATAFARAFALGFRDPKFIAEIVANDTIFDRVLALLPEHEAIFRLSRAEDLAQRGQKDEAKAVLARIGDFPQERAERPPALFAQNALRLRRAHVYNRLGSWTDAAADISRAAQRTPNNWSLAHDLAVTRLLAGDLAGYRAVCVKMLQRFGSNAAHNSYEAESAAKACVYVPDTVTDLPALIRVAERSVLPPDGSKRVVGAACYRAGRYEEALTHFAQSNEVLPPRAWDQLFLAMIHSRLGHAGEARRLLDQADQWIAEADKSPQATPANVTDQPQWQNVLEPHTTRLLRSEAEALIVYDPAFPADPFAH